MKLSAKIMIFVLSTTIVIFIATVSYIAIKSRDFTLENTKRLTDSYSREYAYLIKAELDVDLDVARTLAHSFLGQEAIPPELRKQVYNEMLIKVYENHFNYLAVWANWELFAYEPDYPSSYGRARSIVHIENDEISITEDTLDVADEDENTIYYSIKTGRVEVILEPYYFSYTGSKDDKILETSLVVPIMRDGEFTGATGIDVSLTRFQSLTDTISPFKGSYAFFVSNNGKYVAHPNPAYINQSIAKIDSTYDKRYDVIKNIQMGKKFQFVKNEMDGSQSYISIAPITIGNTTTPWAFGLVVPMETIMKQAKDNFQVSLTVGLIGLMILSIGTWLLARYVTSPIQRITQILKELAKGSIYTSEKLSVRTTDEIGQMRQSVNILLEGLRRTATFAGEIGKGNLNSHFSILSNQDVLGNALLDMRKSLLLADDEENKRKEIDRQQKWATAGIANFAELLRKNSENLEDLSFTIIRDLVKYLNANQGGIFLVNEDNSEEVFLELMSAYAYDTKKFIKNRVEFGENLIGRCAQERETIFLTDIPKEYIKITSGLGDDNPTSLILIPLLSNNQIHGVVEIASFHVFQQYEINFVERVGESIASTIFTVKNNIQTNKLLKESNEKSIELASQEEEMRQNMEEMQTTQEETQRREESINSLWRALNTCTSVIEYDATGKILSVNDWYLQTTKQERGTVMGKLHKDFSPLALTDISKYKIFWDEILSGHTKEYTHHTIIKNKDLFLAETYTPIFDTEGNVYRVLNIGVNFTKNKTKELDLRAEINSLKKQIGT